MCLMDIDLDASLSFIHLIIISIFEFHFEKLYRFI